MPKLATETRAFKLVLSAGTVARETQPKQLDADGSIKWTEPFEMRVPNTAAQLVAIVVSRKFPTSVWSPVPGFRFAGFPVQECPLVWQHMPEPPNAGPSFYAEVETFAEGDRSEGTAGRPSVMKPRTRKNLYYKPSVSSYGVASNTSTEVCSSVGDDLDHVVAGNRGELVGENVEPPQLELLRASPGEGGGSALASPIPRGPSASVGKSRELKRGLRNVHEHIDMHLDVPQPLISRALDPSTQYFLFVAESQQECGVDSLPVPWCHRRKRSTTSGDGHARRPEDDWERTPLHGLIPKPLPYPIRNLVSIPPRPALKRPPHGNVGKGRRPEAPANRQTRKLQKNRLLSEDNDPWFSLAPVRLHAQRVADTRQTGPSPIVDVGTQSQTLPCGDRSSLGSPVSADSARHQAQRDAKTSEMEYKATTQDHPDAPRSMREDVPQAHSSATVKHDSFRTTDAVQPSEEVGNHAGTNLVFISCFGPPSVYEGICFELSFFAYLDQYREEALRTALRETAVVPRSPWTTPRALERRATVQLVREWRGGGGSWLICRQRAYRGLKFES